MLKNVSKILERRMGASTTTVDEMRDLVGHAVNSRRHLGRSEAVYQAARELGLTPRRVLSILRAEVGRVWADELETARRWYAHHCDKQARALAHEAAIYQVRAEELRKRLA